MADRRRLSFRKPNGAVSRLAACKAEKHSRPDLAWLAAILAERPSDNALQASAAVAQDNVYLKSVRTLSAARILLIAAQSVRVMIGRDAAFARAMINELALRYRDIARALKNEKLRSGGERIANWILCASDEQEPNRTIELKYEKCTLASHLGMTPENLSRSLAHLSEHGICSRGARIEITDRSALVRFAVPNQLLDG